MTGEDIKQVVDKEENDGVLDNCVFSRKDFVGSGSTLLNLALTDNPRGSFRKGSIISFVGDSSAGKTFFSMTMFAEAMIHKHFKDHRIIYDDTEGGNSINLAKFFGQEVADKVEEPSNGCSTTIEEFYFNLDDALNEGKPFIYVMDSMDGVSSVADNSKFEEQKKANRKGKETAGSFGASKAKVNSEGLRVLSGKLKNSESIVFLISQTRDDLGFGFNTKTRSGGKSIKFYSNVEMWASVTETIKKTVNGKPRIIGNNVKLKVTKNRYTGFKHEVTVPILPSYGIDDITSCVDYLISEKEWTGSGSKINAPDFDYKGTFKGLIKHIEDNGLENELSIICGRVWKEIKDKCSSKRKGRY